MHKIFAKPLFLGKKVLFLSQCHSTNEELLSLARKSNEPEGLVVYTDHQKKGRGQRGNAWLDEPGKNILMSVLLRPGFLIPSKQYLLNLIAGLAALDVLREVINSQTISLKWPNDIYIDEKKVGGILIESAFKGTILEYAVLGIGININQGGFNLLNATSVFLETGIHLDRLDVMDDFLHYLEKWFLKLKNGKEELILEAYHNNLLWKDELHSFIVDGREQKGMISGIDQNGKLKLEIDFEVRLFNIKEIEFIR